MYAKVIDEVYTEISKNSRSPLKLNTSKIQKQLETAKNFNLDSLKKAAIPI
jgi:hypothetical protein